MSDSELKKSPTGWNSVKQQTVAAWQPVYTTKTVSPLLIFFGIILIPLGVVFFHFSGKIQEIKIDYTDCISVESSSGEKCADIIRRDRKDSCNCLINFEVSEDMEGKIYMYYALTNFFQNHREYVKSRDDNQLLGEIGSVNNLAIPAKECQPLDKDSDGKIIFPCGAIANSMFNDSINLLISDGSGKRTKVDLIRNGIAWESDKKHKFKNPDLFINNNDPIWKNFVKPRDWNRTLWDLDPEHPDNNGVQNEDFIVWMRTAALPNFRKLYRIIDSKSLGLNDRLRKGNYSLEIAYEFEVKSFDGTKSIVLSEVNSFIGGRNPNLGIIYMSVGGVLMVFGLLFLLGYVKQKKSWSRGSSGKRQDYGTCRPATENGNRIG